MDGNPQQVFDAVNQVTGWWSGKVEGSAAEWVGTDIVFDISPRGAQTELRFTHRGLRPEFECHEACSNAWGLLVGDNLRRFITTGQPQPSPW